MKKIVLSVLTCLIVSICLADNLDYAYVDLELPSGTLWATCNVGAGNPWEHGTFYKWAETMPSKESTGDKYWDSQRGEYSKYGSLSENPKREVLEASDDAATVNMGNNWRMPTIEEWNELREYCDWVWTANYQGKSVNGYQVISKKNPNKSIFLPAYLGYGDYWSASRGIVGSRKGAGIEFYERRVGRCDFERKRGLMVRAVMSKK